MSNSETCSEFRLISQELININNMLKQTENIKLIFDSINCGVLIIDPQSHKIVMANRIANEIIGLKAEDIVGRECYSFVCASEKGQCPITDLGERIVNDERVIINNEKCNIPITKMVVPVVLEGKEYLVESFIDISSQKKTESVLCYISNHDTLTGLFNRAYFQQLIAKISPLDVQSMGIFMFDLDGLKTINDTLGQETGDKLLCITADMLKGCFHKYDIIARMGGDEFIVLVNNCTEETAKVLYKNMREKVDEYNRKAEISLSISIGYATNSSNNPLLIDNLIKLADDNMYKEKLLHRQSARSAIVNTLMRTLGERDFITSGHADRMQDLVTLLGKEAEIADHQFAGLQLLAQFHDIGKIGIPDNVLNKPGKLDSEERKVMEQHSEIGYRIAKAASVLYEIGDLIRLHHEWWDGSGYPLGLTGYEIPLECRILAIIDAYDAMTSDRPYRKAMSTEEALQELTDGAWTQFDPVLVKKFVNLKRNGII